MGQGTTWTDQLPWVILGIRTAPKEDLKKSFHHSSSWPNIHHKYADECTRRVPTFLNIQRWATNSTTYEQTQQSNNIHTKEIDLKSICVHEAEAPGNPLQAPYTRSYRVLEHRPKTCLIDYGGIPEWISVDWLKPSQVDPVSPVQVATPSKTGWPPKKSTPLHANDSDQAGGEPWSGIKAISKFNESLTLILHHHVRAW